MGIPILGAARSSPDKAYATAVKRGAKDINGQPGSLRAYFDYLYEDAATLGINADVLVSQWDLETASGTSAGWVQSGNPAGLGMFDDGSTMGLRFNPEHAARAHVTHMALYCGIEPDASWITTDARWDAAMKAGYFGSVKTTSDLGNGRWATDPLYGSKLLGRYAAYFGAAPVVVAEDTVMGFNIGNRKMRIAAGVGHANLSGGNPLELAFNRKVMAALLALAAQSDGFDVRCYTPDNGQGTFPGSLDQVVYATVHKWSAAGWHPDVVFEIHSEGVSNQNVRGGFIINPDSFGLRGRKASGGDFIDQDVLAAGAAMAKAITSAVGVPLRGDGVMSERETGVGIDGWRLGYFGALSDPAFQNNSCVFISEAATHTSPADLAIMNKPDFPANEARGLLEAVAILGTTRGNWTYPYKIGTATPAPAPQPVPAATVVAVTELDRFADVAAAMVPGFVDFHLEGKAFRAIFVGDRWQAARETPRYGFPDKTDKRRTGPNIPKGDAFDVRWVVFRRDVQDAKIFGRSPWGTFIDIEDTNRVGDLQAA